MFNMHTKHFQSKHLTCSNQLKHKFEVWSNGPHGGIPTLRTSMGKLWLQNEQRPLLKPELLQAMGWMPKSTPKLTRTRATTCMLGNSWHLAKAITMLMILLASVSPEAQSATLVGVAECCCVVFVVQHASFAHNRTMMTLPRWNI